MIVSEQAANELVRCVLFALKHMDVKHRGAMMYKTREDGSFEMLDWQADFINTLKSAGIEIDEEKLKKIRNGK